MCGADICLAIIAIIFPPLPVWIKRGICSADSLINIALCVLGFIPGLLHAWYVISVTPEPTYDELAQADPERGHGSNQHSVTYYYVSQQPAPHSQQHGYGTVNTSAPNAQFPPPASAQHGAVPPQPQQGAGGSSADTPPSYQQAVEGDHKVQKR